MYHHLPPVKLPDLIQDNRESGRYYVCPNGKTYPSVTTVLGVGNNTWLEEWKARVGPEEAALTSNRASARGSRLHKLCEDTLNNCPSEPSMFDLEVFKQFQKAIARINNISCIEKRLYSDILRVAGTVDLIAEFDGQIAIIDWKTSTRIKHREDISHYFAQAAAYAVAYEELTGIKVPTIVIVMAVDHERDPIIFVEKVKDWVPEFIKYRKIFRLLKNH
jgi:genome maintenance exonuclease 1